ncbi:MAG: SigE family RNA polymerase sigma factor [Actinomycetales bacterium]|nr:SigE family RNA polymerase sigma factor [Actinomycetales bacterium]
MGTSDVVEAAAREHGPALVGYAYLLTGDLATAQDVVQDAFVRAFARFTGRRDPEHVAAYLRQCVLNGVRDGYRRRGTFLAARPRLAAQADPPPDTLASEHVDLQRALGALSPRERACVILRYYDDRSVREVAEALRLSEGAVKRYLADARAKLGDRLAESPDDVVPVRLTRGGLAEGRAR